MSNWVLSYLISRIKRTYFVVLHILKHQLDRYFFIKFLLNCNVIFVKMQLKFQRTFYSEVPNRQLSKIKKFDNNGNLNDIFLSM